MRVSDYIIQFLVDQGVDTLFMLAGGQAMFLNDAVYLNKKIKPICVHHEQAAGMAAEAYGRASGTLGVALVTAGPAAVNVLNGVVGGYVDSAPMMVISGQSHLPNVTYMKQTGIRQCGLQGIYIEPLAKPVTKYFVTIDDPTTVAFHLEKALHIATTGRTGPVWIDVPLDIQRMEVPLKLLTHFSEPPKESVRATELKKAISHTVDILAKAKRPLLLLGQGVRIAKADDLVLPIVDAYKPVIATTRLGIDLVPSKTRGFVGRPGLYGDRSANMATQMADAIIVIGARLDPGIVGWESAEWGKNAQKVILDIDEKELAKPGIMHAQRFCVDAKDFLEGLLAAKSKKATPDTKAWISYCEKLMRMYPTVDPSYKKEHPVNSYYFTERLSQASSSKDTILVDTSSPFHVVCQAWNLKKGQRLLTTGGISTMGYWVAGIGAAMARKKSNTIVITGDGCLQMNIQELATLAHNKLPIKLFVINNNGYLLIRHTQRTHMSDRLIGESPKTGVWCPPAIPIAKAYGIPTVKIRSVSGIDEKIAEVLGMKGPVVCDVDSPEWQPIIPRISSSKLPDGRMVSRPYEDMYPFLPPDELSAVMEKGRSL